MWNKQGHNRSASPFRLPFKAGDVYCLMSERLKTLGPLPSPMMAPSASTSERETLLGESNAHRFWFGREAKRARIFAENCRGRRLSRWHVAPVNKQRDNPRKSRTKKMRRRKQKGTGQPRIDI